MKTKLIIVSSITHALQAKSELEKHRISTKIQKTTKYSTANSCAYGIKVSSKNSLDAMRIIRSINIEILDFIDQEKL